MSIIDDIIARQDAAGKAALKDIFELAQQGQLAVMYDLDGASGVFSPGQHDGFAPDPELIEIYKGLDAATGGAVAPVTGRPLKFIETLLDGYMPYCAVEHGSLIFNRGDAALIHTLSVPELETLHAKVEALIEGIEGAQVEKHKLGTLTVEFTRAANNMALGERLEAEIKAAVADNPDIHVKNGSIPINCYIEVMHRESGKGQAVDVLMERPEFAGKRPIFFEDTEAGRSGMESAQKWNGYAIGVTEHAPDCSDIRLKDHTETRALSHYLISLMPK